MLAKDSPAVVTPSKISQPLVQSPPVARCEVCVIVPVRNEAATLQTTLNALENQVDLNHQRLHFDRYEIILLANNCSDDSAAIARRFAQQHPQLNLHVVERTLPPSEAHIGRVRQLLMDEAYRRLSQIGRKRGVIASTDGDSQVSPTWIAATLHEIERGADAVGGRIMLDRAGLNRLDPYAKACHLREVGYRSLIAELESYLDPDPHDRSPRHYQHYGASFAVTAEIYAQAGGMPLVRTPEDVALYRALLRVNARFRHSPIVRVTTSARQTGRAELGLANQLNVWTAMGQQRQPFLVESAAAIVARLQARHQLRELWGRSLSGYPPSIDLHSLADRLGIAAEWLQQELAQPQTFGLLYERVEQRQQVENIWAQRWPLVAIEFAIQELRIHLEKIKQCHNVNVLKAISK
ncbi:glycosyltransferase [Microcoleus sp. FACHB-1515]|uniref:glycosyltransferase n=1 Tax=Cyanophyceae TaxID=3028117 RepID=UPI001686A759|nr:glycosyltransferase [Microcoleus sp. FACHB-1515]MBD2091243.1 glycosyltransferase [Microcoleus sp. FACHB-1515]